MIVHELAALTAATCWALTGLISFGPAKHLGAIGFNRIRMIVVFVMLAIYVLIFGGWESIETQHLPLIVLSGFVGIFLGDTALFLTLNRLGPRRTAIMFAMNAPIATLLAWIFLDEALPVQSLVGILLIIPGVILAIAFGKRASQIHQWEHVSGSLWVGIGLGLLAASFQALGALFMRPVMQLEVDPVASSAIRIGVAALGLTLLMQLPVKRFKQANPLNISIFSAVVLSGFIGMGVGMTLFIFSLAGGEVGIVTTLSATTPIILLPLLWIRTKEPPALGAWIGALLVVTGTAFIFLN